ncbi:Deoxyribonuclease-1 [Nymphon striatum]|nr:Deoxyribonuclease-1 [Nymphon striatum]
MHLKIILVALMSMLVIVESNEIRIGAYNVKRFGITFWSNSAKAAGLIEVVKKYDLIVIQEIVDKSEASIYKLMYRLHVDENLPMKLYLSPRIGTSSYKEQYGIIYRSDKLNLISVYQHTDQTLFERPPVLALFEWTEPTTAFEFSVIAMHASADSTDTDQELNSLAEVWSTYNSIYKNAMIIGDLNAGCSYVTDSDRSGLTLWTSSDYSFLIENNADTTTTESTHCAYDRIIFTGTELENHLVDGSNKVYKFEDFEDPITTAKLLSDHYPVEEVRFTLHLSACGQCQLESCENPKNVLPMDQDDTEDIGHPCNSNNPFIGKAFNRKEHNIDKPDVDVALYEMEKSEIEQRKLLRDEKIRQQLRINSPELREFQSKLLTDSVKKHREYQMAEKTVRDLEKQNLVKILAEQREIKQQQDNHLEEMNMIAEFNRKKKYNHVLQDQLEDKHRLYEKMKRGI